MHTYELASHTFACVSLPVTCTVNWIVLRLVAVMELSSYDVLIFEDLLLNVFCGVCRYCNIPTNWQPPKKKEFVERVSVCVWGGTV